MSASAATARAAKPAVRRRSARRMYLFFKALALPPANLTLVILFGLLLRRRARRTGTLIASLGALGLYLLSTSFVASRLLVAVEAGIEAPEFAEAGGERPRRSSCCPRV